MRRAGAAAIALLAGLGPLTCVHAGDALDRLKGCAQFEGMARLKCVDELLGEAPEPAAPQGPSWIVSETTSPVDYKPQVTARINGQPSSRDAPSSLAIHCRAGRTELTISGTGSAKPWPDGEVSVAYRINDEPQVEQRWRAVENGRSLAATGDVVRLLRALPDGGRLVVRITAGKDPPSESTFQLAGLDPVRRKLAAACNWPQP